MSLKTVKKGRVLSGMRPTGRLHLGHLLGALNNWVRLQDEYECFYEVANWHALTDHLDTKNFSDNIYYIVRDWLAAGIDPEKSTMFLQSDIVEHSELHLLLSMLVPVPWLERCATFKEKVKDMHLGKAEISYGLLGYPVLQAADILIYKANAVPVGEDQLPHLELTREIARRFNYYYGKVFPEPEALLTQTSKLLGLDGQKKMGKSYENYISLDENPQEIAKKIQGMFTDPRRIRLKEPGHPDHCNVFTYYTLFAAKEVADEISVECRTSKIGCTDCKKNLAGYVERYLQPIQQAQKKWTREKVREILQEGAKRAQTIARATMEEVRRAMKATI